MSNGGRGWGPGIVIEESDINGPRERAIKRNGRTNLPLVIKKISQKKKSKKSSSFASQKKIVRNSVQPIRGW